ncbi:glyoxylase-like metal-dependent hydrolase (beta-lactamase superfamily II) [Saccharothrix tamanrassetensis]|uniref:Glyoxylase-like metal-dependent hydrolase (Beta-lactamase superfamily II) n=1 Tax=Saccharothrix tamanrassetensis TaxID=1051531 RepID=A0A841CKI4_9PSEU|nr:MBL fold metallo-hydrolase [Saccharothrix tamanrassetensis]MBB5956874.1 glyoxylase-like metal-dependent hydrolase (beta-lactamase superfamily II) [Saccharothrix tamanrassetensis]
MEIIDLVPGLRMLRFPIGQAYVWQDGDELTVIDTGMAGYAQNIAALGKVVRIVITHFHHDHTGSLAKLRELTGAPVYAHPLDASVIRGDVDPPSPVIPPEERELFDRITPGVPFAPRSEVDHEVDEGTELPFGGGAKVLSIPGHTDGSIAIHLPQQGILFTGDTIAVVDGKAIPGVFNLDRARLLDSVQRLTDLSPQVLCVGHGDPLISA